jgi:hypothetical protein
MDVITGACNKPFGFVRLQVTRLIAVLIATGSSEVQKELASLDTFPLLLVIQASFKITINDLFIDDFPFYRI